MRHPFARRPDRPRTGDRRHDGRRPLYRGHPARVCRDEPYPSCLLQRPRSAGRGTRLSRRSQPDPRGARWRRLACDPDVRHAKGCARTADSDRLVHRSLFCLSRPRPRRPAPERSRMKAWARFLGIATLTASLAACGSSSELRPLTVVGWGGSSQDAHRNAYWTSFSRTTGIPLREDSWRGGVGVIRTKVVGGDTSWDIVQVETEDLILGCEEGL